MPATLRLTGSGVNAVGGGGFFGSVNLSVFWGIGENSEIELMIL